MADMYTNGHQQGFLEGLEWALKYNKIVGGMEYRNLLEFKIKEINNDINGD